MPPGLKSTSHRLLAKARISPSASGPPRVALVRMYCTLSGWLIRARRRRISREVSMPVAPL